MNQNKGENILKVELYGIKALCVGINIIREIFNSNVETFRFINKSEKCDTYCGHNVIVGDTVIKKGFKFCKNIVNTDDIVGRVEMRINASNSRYDDPRDPTGPAGSAHTAAPTNENNESFRDCISTFELIKTKEILDVTIDFKQFSTLLKEYENINNVTFGISQKNPNQLFLESRDNETKVEHHLTLRNIDNTDIPTDVIALGFGYTVTIQSRKFADTLKQLSKTYVMNGKSESSRIVMISIKEKEIIFAIGISADPNKPCDVSSRYILPNSVEKGEVKIVKHAPDDKLNGNKEMIMFYKIDDLMPYSRVPDACFQMDLLLCPMNSEKNFVPGGICIHFPLGTLGVFNAIIPNYVLPDIDYSENVNNTEKSTDEILTDDDTESIHSLDNLDEEPLEDDDLLDDLEL